MLIITTSKKQPSDFRVFAQNRSTYEVCGYTEQDGYEEVQDIPSGFVQCALPPQYGAGHLTLAQITRGLMMEQGALEQLDADVFYIAMMTGVEL